MHIRIFVHMNSLNHSFIHYNRSISTYATHTNSSTRGNATQNFFTERGGKVTKRSALETVSSNWHRNDNNEKWQVRSTSNAKLFTYQNTSHA